MNRHYALALCLCLLLIFAAGCEQTSIAEQEQIKSFQTLQASTPTQAPPPTPSPAPTVTPLPPTPTPNPALANFSLCTQTAGTADGGRFSARITTITTTLQPAFERVTIGLAVPGDSAPPHATARCLSASDDPGGAASGYSLLIDLDGWLHDDAFKATTI